MCCKQVCVSVPVQESISNAASDLWEGWHQRGDREKELGVASWEQPFSLSCSQFSVLSNWEAIHHCFDLWVSQDVCELHVGTLHTKLWFLALSLTRLCVLLVYGFPAGPYASFCLQKVGAWWISEAQLGLAPVWCCVTAITVPRAQAHQSPPSHRL